MKNKSPFTTNCVPPSCKSLAFLLDAIAGPDVTLLITETALEVSSVDIKKCFTAEKVLWTKTELGCWPNKEKALKSIRNIHIVNSFPERLWTYGLCSFDQWRLQKCLTIRNALIMNFNHTKYDSPNDLKLLQIEFLLQTADDKINKLNHIQFIYMHKFPYRHLFTIPGLCSLCSLCHFENNIFQMLFFQDFRDYNKKELATIQKYQHNQKSLKYLLAKYYVKVSVMCHKEDWQWQTVYIQVKRRLLLDCIRIFKDLFYQHGRNEHQEIVWSQELVFGRLEEANEEIL